MNDPFSNLKNNASLKYNFSLWNDHKLDSKADSNLNKFKKQYKFKVITSFEYI